MYVCTSFRGAKSCNIGKKGVFFVSFTNLGKDMIERLRIKHAKVMRN